MSIAALEIGRAAGGRGKKAFSGFVVDVPLLLILLAIASYGLIVLYSAADDGLGGVTRQGLRLGLGLAAFFVLSQVPPRYYRMWAPYAYLLRFGLLLAVMIEGEIGKGAQRWLDLGFVRFQPSEITKIAVPMTVAWFMHERRLPPTLPQLITLAIIVLVPAILIAEQPDLGTALLVVAAGGIGILLAG